MNQKNVKEEWEFFKKKVKEHWKIALAAIIAGVCAIIGATLVFLWHVQTSEFGAQGTANIGQWTVGWIWGFCLMLLLWELLFVGLPALGVFGIGGYLWWERLSEEEKKEFKDREKEAKKHRARKAGGAGGVMFIPYSIYIYVIGHFGTQFGTFPYTFWLYAYFWTFIWMLIIIGIPAAIILIIVYFTVWRKKPEAKEPEVKE
jgi:hypothetical protein